MSDRAGQLISSGRFKEAARWLAARPTQSQSDQIHRAQLELEMGDLWRAKSFAESLLNGTLDGPDRAICLSTLGRALGRLGFVNEGLTALRRSIDAASVKHKYLEATLRGRFVVATFNWVGIEPALTELPQLKTAALASGNTNALVDFHISQGRVAAMEGWIERAEAESDISMRLLSQSENLIQSARIAELRAVIALKTSDIASAKRYSTEAIAVAEEAGAKFFIATAYGNLAHLALMEGDFDEGRRCLQHLIDYTEARGRVRMGAYSTGVELGLAVGDVEYAIRMLRAGEEFEAIDPAAPPYYALWFALSKSRWQLAEKRFVDAAASANAALNPAARFAGADLLAQLSLVTAEAYARMGDVGAAAQVLTGVSNQRPSLETFSEVSRVAAVIAALAGNCVTAHSLLARADRVLSAQGLHGSRKSLHRTATEFGLCLDDGAEPNSIPQSILDSASAVLQLGRHPLVVGAEVIWLMNHLRVVKGAVLIENDGTKIRAVQATGNANDADKSKALSVTLELGSAGGRSYHIEAAPTNSAADSMLWRSLEQLVRIASTLGSDDSNVILWPIETPAEQLGMIVTAKSMLDLLETCEKLASSSIAVLLTGETGTGKELLARALHDRSLRRHHAFIPFNCSACSRDMLDAQLFGYKRGAFTGANEAFQGVIRAAAGGTLFLDEIGEITLDVQPKLLRFLESGEIHPLGEPRPLHVDVRVVAATNADLEKLVAEGKFREDLFYRLNVVRLQVPPLRERREEIPPLVQHYLDKCSRESQKTGIRIADETMEYLILFKWPGNVRQLANEVRRLVALAESGAVLMPEHLSNDIASSRRTIPASERWIAPMEFVVRMDQPMSAAIEHLERSMVQYALKTTAGRLEDAAQLLGLSRKGLYLKRQRLQITDIPTVDDSVAAVPSAENERVGPAH